MGDRLAVVFLHAHPDDEAIFTGGTMARLADRGVRVVLVVATRGELGEVRRALGPGEVLWRRRAAETERAAAVLGVERLEFLGYHDSGMRGAPENDDPRSFWSAPPDEAADKLSAILLTEAPRALVTYDEHGIYGHPDHVQAHRVGSRAAQLAGVDVVYEATVDREYLHFVERHLVAEGFLTDDEVPDLVHAPIGVSSVEVTTEVDVGEVLERKRAAMAAHASQIPETASAMVMTGASFAEVYGLEWYVRRGPAGPIDALVRSS